MILLKIEQGSLAFGPQPLLDSISFYIEEGEKLFLIGRNGMGKSSLFKVLTGELALDQGSIYRREGLRIGVLSQNMPFSNITVYEAVAAGLQELGDLLTQYYQITQNLELYGLEKLEVVQKQIELKQGWHYIQMVETVITQLELPKDARVDTLSGGWQRRVLLAQALVGEPDLLLLDEPTNHLDLPAIEWLEKYLQQYKGTLLCITHDREFLNTISSRIIELDRGNLTSWPGNYEKYLLGKQQQLEAEARHNALFDKKLAREETWIRQGIKARRTRNEGRVQALKQLRLERAKRIELQGKPTFTSNSAGLSGDLVIEAKAVNYAVDGKVLVKNFAISVFRGDKIALIGGNGVGKSTLLKLLLGQLMPQSGTIKRGTNLQFGYFEQMRSQLDYNLSAIDNVAGGRETITVNGKEKHIISYLGDFLFTPERARLPLKSLSGGECNRVLLARLFSFPSNLLILDEPTNDLDLETLELLEEILNEYKGTLLLVSHDRAFMNAVVSSSLYFYGNGEIQEFIGGYNPAYEAINTVVATKEDKDKITSPTVFTNAMKKELGIIVEKINKLEKLSKDLQQEITTNEFYQLDVPRQKQKYQQIEQIGQELESLLLRWEELEQLKSGK